MSLDPHAGGPFIEQATAAPGEQRAVPYTVRCWKSIKDNTLNRCQLRIGHDGDCQGMTPDELAMGGTDG